MDTDWLRDPEALVYIIGAVAVLAMTFAVDCIWRLNEKDAEDDVRDARLTDLGEQVYDLRARMLPASARPTVGWWQHPETSLEEQLNEVLSRPRWRHPWKRRDT